MIQEIGNTPARKTSNSVMKSVGTSELKRRESINVTKLIVHHTIGNFLGHSVDSNANQLNAFLSL